MRSRRSLKIGGGGKHCDIVVVVVVSGRLVVLLGLRGRLMA